MEIAVAQQSEPTLAELIGRVRETMRRRWKVMALVAAIVFILGTVATYLITPQYTSTVRVRIDPTRDPVASQNGNAKSELSDEAIDTEVSAFYSLGLAKEVVKELDLVKDPEFAKALEASSAAVANSADRETAVAGLLLQNLGVYREQQTYVINVDYVSPDPIKASQVANTFADKYIEGAVGSRTSVAASQAEWYQEQLLQLSDQVRSADAAAARFRAENGLALGASEGGFGAGTITDQQVPALSGSLAEAESAAAAARASYQAARQQASRSRSGEVKEVLDSPVMSSLRNQRAVVIQARGEAQTRYGARHPQVQKIDTQLADIDQQIAEESRRVIASLASVSAAADAQASSLKSSLDRLEDVRSNQTRASVIADSLDREANAKRDLYKQLTEESQGAMQASKNSMSSATVVDRAIPPEDPSSPNKPLYLALALIAGLAAGAATIAVQEMLSGTIRNADDVEQKLGLRLLSVIPRVTEGEPANVMLERPTSYFAESLRIARTALLGAGAPHDDLHVIGFTSSVPAEGKTTTSLSFARTLAVAGVRTLLIDCDVRRAAMQGTAGIKAPDKGLVDYLSGDAASDDIVVASGLDNLDLILVRAPHFASTNLFEGNRMRDLIATARASYECVILDLPPLMGLADGRMIAAHADAVVFVVKWDDTPISVATSAVDALRAIGKEPVGVLVNSVEEKAELLGGGYYSSRYTYYYEGTPT